MKVYSVMMRVMIMSVFFRLKNLLKSVCRLTGRNVNILNIENIAEAEIMRFILNNTYGINGEDKIDLKKIIEKFGCPITREIISDSGSKNFTVNYIYENIGLRIFYNLYYFVDKEGAEFQTMSFIMEKLYLNESTVIKKNDDMRKVLEKIKYYHKKVNKEFEYEYEEDKYWGSYDFVNLDVMVNFEKKKGLKFLDDIYVSLPYEDNPAVFTLEEILYME